MRLLLAMGALTVAAQLPSHAQACRPENFTGAYGFQLYGTATISGRAQPAVDIGRVEFDGKGGVTGVSSANFAGFYLGNAVTGAYEIGSDCALTWSLRDDSGNVQHFAGKVKPDLDGGSFRQTDPGAPQNGTLAKTADDCSPQALKHSYHVSIYGGTVAMESGETAQKVSYDGVMETDANGGLQWVQNEARVPAGTAKVSADCIVDMDLTLPAPMKLRGVLVNSGMEILGIETAPGAAVHTLFRAQ